MDKFFRIHLPECQTLESHPHPFARIPLTLITKPRISIFIFSIKSVILAATVISFENKVFNEGINVITF